MVPPVVTNNTSTELIPALANEDAWPVKALRALDIVVRGVFHALSIEVIPINELLRFWDMTLTSPPPAEVLEPAAFDIDELARRATTFARSGET
eukprot:CAMPEP_0171510192 /NCGR_PEP_ID=MMETSP0959-20130129/224_1 /TAXON_ID=87120 /ORGANISM="Aurantiochytrium limacinum, Strain ATCCMYA-1381" /LENGTH=93 /DNA_ID=CAMNT_0012047523 /DNA_START=556 /DNA_END=834 /DNA_ORIENTATION=+